MPAALAGTMFPSPYFGDAGALGSSGYNYPAASWFLAFKGVNGSGTVLEKHFIWYAGEPSTLFNSAPNCSLMFDTTNNKAYLKTAASTWTVIGSVT